jgi:glutathione S-transferase
MIILFGTNGSPYVSRVRMQAYAKGLPIELRPRAFMARWKAQQTRE